VPDGAELDSTGDVISNGRVVSHHEPCTPAQMGNVNGGEANQRDKVIAPRIGHAWVEYSWAWAGNINGQAFFDGLDADWAVPAAPGTSITGTDPHGIPVSNLLLYYFPSFESSTGTEIVQPVLQWGSNGSFGGLYWTIAAWYCGPSGCAHSPAYRVYPGDVIHGTITATVWAKFGYFVQISDAARNAYSSNTFWVDGTLDRFNNVQGGVMEVYNVAQCLNYPTDNALLFYDIVARQAGPLWNSFNVVHPAWSNYVNTSLSPQCNYHAFTGANAYWDYTVLYY